MSGQLKDRIADAIRVLAEGNGATLDAITLHPELMSLDCVVAQATDDGRRVPELDAVAAVVALLLEEAANSLDAEPNRRTEPNRAIAARVALGLEPGTQRRPLRGKRNAKGRAPTIARWLGYAVPSLFNPRSDGRSPFDELIEGMAEYLVRYESAHQVTERRLAAQARRPPLESAMRVDWLARFEDYFRIWSYVTGLTADLALVLRLRISEPEAFDRTARKSLYYYARFLAELHRFTAQRGGLWVLPDPVAEQKVADATWMMRQPTPLGEVDESMLRIAVTAWDEIAPFVQATYRDAALRRIAASWIDWLQACACEDAENRNKDCGVHECLHWGTFFITTLETQWDGLADWYEVERPQSAVVQSEEAG
jgi:hypothetical protein